MAVLAGQGLRQSVAVARRTRDGSAGSPTGRRRVRDRHQRVATTCAVVVGAHPVRDLAPTRRHGVFGRPQGGLLQKHSPSRPGLLACRSAPCARPRPTRRHGVFGRPQGGLLQKHSPNRPGLHACRSAPCARPRPNAAPRCIRSPTGWAPTPHRVRDSPREAAHSDR